MDENDTSYPPAEGRHKSEAQEKGRGYRDDAAADLFKQSGGTTLTRSAGKLSEALLKQAEKMSEFYSTPFTTKSAKTMLVTLEAIERVELQLERWHHLVYPNQKPGREE